jgi:hypothetical protein
MTISTYEENKRKAAEERMKNEINGLRKQVIEQACQIAMMAKEIERHEITIRLQTVKINYLEGRMQ